MVGQREQCKWALWAALILAVFAGYGCGSTDPGASGDDRVTDTREERAPDADARTEGTDMDAAHSAAWMEALDGLARSGDVDQSVSDIQPDATGDLLDGMAGAEVVTPAPPAPTVYVAPPQAPAPPVFDTSCAAQVVLYDWDIDEALYVMSKESGGDPWALNPSGACGCFQMLACVGYGDPVANVAAAYGKWQDQANHMGHPGFHWHWFRWWP